MPVHISTDALLLFQGDSITAAGRDLQEDRSLGNGYVSLIARELAARGTDVRILNRGVSGHRAAELRSRWHEDAVALKPDLLSVMVGVNDTWRRYDSQVVTTTADYEDDYRAMLRASQDAGARIILVEPFLIPVRDEQWSWREDLDARIHVVRRLASEFDAALLAADGLLNQAAREAGDPSLISEDGVHLTAAGHAELAAAWIRLVSVD
ncbi:GDSL-type esterase/lipase family protein [Streptomyces sp. NPDC003247]|uniref:GDSL-type esterase/lipase family protein n=1 Tax=Streptomyces sp. NPDC003247 TaxID=3364677 RepID=UPI0036B18B8D